MLPLGFQAVAFNLPPFPKVSGWCLAQGSTISNFPAGLHQAGLQGLQKVVQGHADLLSG